MDTTNEAPDVTPAAKVCGIIEMTNGLFLVVCTGPDGTQALHTRGIRREAALLMAADLNEQPSPSSDFEEIACRFDLRAALAASLRDVLGKSPDEMAEHLAHYRPWVGFPEPEELPF